MLTYLVTGTILGLSAGFAPGPLLALVISETMQHDVKAGIRVALAPVLTDLPIIAVTLLILARLARFDFVLGVIAIIGAGFILYLGIENLRIKNVQADIDAKQAGSLRKGILANVLSPHPYLFWFSVGGPTTIKAMATGIAPAVMFIVSFYFLLVGSKVFLAQLVARSRSFLSGDRYILTMRLLGLLLIILAGLLLQDGLQLLKILQPVD